MLWAVFGAREDLRDGRQADRVPNNVCDRGEGQPRIEEYFMGLWSGVE